MPGRGSGHRLPLAFRSINNRSTEVQNVIEELAVLLNRCEGKVSKFIENLGCAFGKSWLHSRYLFPGCP